ncbi:MAG: GAF domain-containing sensor histidine kinase [Chloroflexota bacterium]|nr:GAF domain-containing sensor histidine kinase [Chloroflexota bacterium]
MTPDFLSVIRDPARLTALRRLALLDSPTEEAFDRLARLAVKILKVPVALVSFVDEERQFFMSCVGLPEPWATQRETPLSHSFCQHAVTSGEPFIVEDAHNHQLVRDNLAIPDLGVVAYAGIPLIISGGYALGALCAIDSKPRTWTEDELATLQELAALVMTEIELRSEIIERKRMEEERVQLLESERAARAQAEAALRARDEFLLVAAHELKNPVTSLIGYTQLLQRRAEREDLGNPRNRQVLNVLSSQVRRLHRLTLSLFDLSQLATGQFTIENSLVDLTDLTRRLVEETRLALSQHTLEFSRPSEPILVEGDELRLEQVLYNLLQNAIKYSPNGGLIHVQIEMRDEWVYLSISDQGIGIPAETLPHLFERFYRAPNVGSQHIGGMGLGLYVVKEIISLHRGIVEVKSIEGEGTTVTVALPLHHVPKSLQPAVSSSEPATL